MTTRMERLLSDAVREILAKDCGRSFGGHCGNKGHLMARAALNELDAEHLMTDEVHDGAGRGGPRWPRVERTHQT